MSTTNQIECPRCSGVGYISAFGHIDNGRCFLCAGAGRLDERKAAAWVAARATPDTRPKGKVVELEGFGKCTIRPNWKWKSNTGARLFVLTTVSDVGELDTCFGIGANGKVFLEFVCGGHEDIFLAPGDTDGGYIFASDSYKQARNKARAALRSVIQAAVK